MHSDLHPEISINISTCKLPDIPANGAANIFKKFSAFETQVIENISSILHRMDKDSSVLVTGSYRNNPDDLRQTSDIDMILLSRSLRIDGYYVDFLKAFKEMSDDFRERTNISPVFFTTVAGENNFIYMAKQERKQEVVPIHVLYYKDENELFHLEPTGLATRLMTSAKVIKGKEHYHIVATEEKVTAIEKIRWDVERAIAELVLNDGFIDKHWLYSNFNSNVCVSIRGQSDVFGTENSMYSVLNYFDPTRVLLEKFGPHFSIRHDVNVIPDVTQKELLEGPLALLRILEHMQNRQLNNI